MEPAKRRRIIPGFAPEICPNCGSDFIVAGFRSVKRKRLVAPRIEVEETVELPVYYCGECGYVISRAFLDGDVITGFGATEVEMYIVEDVNGVKHHLIHKEGYPIRPRYGAVEIEKAYRVVPPKPMSALIVVLKCPLTYRNVWCYYEELPGGVSVATDRAEAEIVREARHVREFTMQHLRDFHELIRRVRSAGYKPQVIQGALAYLVACSLSEPKYGGTKSIITGFLRASDVPEYRNAEAKTVGEALSRIQALGLTPEEHYGYWRLVSTVVGEKPTYVYIPVRNVLQEKEYVVRWELAKELIKKPRWWEILEVKKPSEAPKFIGLDKWL
jgi:ribosomal protein S27AE